MGAPFGLGFIGAIPSGANPTPVQLALARDLTFEYTEELKPLPGNYGFAKDMGRAKRTASVKAKYVYWQAAGVAALLSGSTSAAGVKLMAVDETAAIPTTPYTVTVTNSAQFDTDWGVVDRTTGLQLTRVASAPATGQYSVAAGVYTFAAADTGHNVAITYSYSAASTGKTITMSNQIMGPATGFVVGGVSGPGSSSRFAGFKLYNAFSSGLTLALKAEDWPEMDVSFDAAEDTTTGKVFDLYVGS